MKEEKRKDKKSTYYERNKEKVKAYQKKNKEKIKAYQKKHKEKKNKTSKICSKCGKYKPYSCFYECRTSSDGYFHTCKDCCKTHTILSDKQHRKHYERYFSWGG